MRAIVLTIAVFVAALVSLPASAADMAVMRSFHRVKAAQAIAQAVIPAGPLNTELVRALAAGEVHSIAVNSSSGNTTVWSGGPIEGDLVIVANEPSGAVVMAVVDGPCIDPLWFNEGPYATATIGNQSVLRYHCS